MICSSDAFANLVFTNPTKLAAFFYLLKTDYCLRLEIYWQFSNCFLNISIQHSHFSICLVLNPDLIKSLFQQHDFQLKRSFFQSLKRLRKQMTAKIIMKIQKQIENPGFMKTRFMKWSDEQTTLSKTCCIKRPCITAKEVWDRSIFASKFPMYHNVDSRVL